MPPRGKRPSFFAWLLTRLCVRLLCRGKGDAVRISCEPYLGKVPNVICPCLYLTRIVFSVFLSGSLPFLNVLGLLFIRQCIPPSFSLLSCFSGINTVAHFLSLSGWLRHLFLFLISYYLYIFIIYYYLYIYYIFTGGKLYSYLLPLV